MTRRIDAHQHFWRYEPGEYGWISEEMDVLRRDFLPEHLVPELHRAGVDVTIAVQARQSLEETRFLLDLASASARIAGVVGWVDLCSDDVERELEEFAGRLVGVRHVLQDEPDDAFCLRADFQRGLGRLCAHGLTYDLLLHPRHLAPALELVTRHPEQAFVLDHLAKPDVAHGKLDPWARDLRALAACDNVCCKLSGLVTEARWNAWEPDDFRPFLEVALEAFGTERLLFGSDWPVCLLAAPDYATVLGLVDDFARPLGEDERAALFGGNAARFYLS